ncbi:RDD family protein [Ureibacillus acetophenoni]|uniref:RDD family protein n=1 Tax=Ureibacillus acetophenoni TaxID=614649 RepID=A0A285UAY4_9BACL|nr:RDD family protein [Ureibacillus acetophenoni]SOC39060.1 RDD family protein [Ureibacillus acetophenoni]
MESTWFYVYKGKQNGPIEESKLLTLFLEGVLDKNTLVWTSNMNDWKAAGECDQLASLFSTITPPPLPLEVSSSTTYKQNGSQTYSKSRPWIRYLAKMFDLCLFFVILSLILPSEVLYEANGVIFGLIGLFLWIFIDSILLTLFGSTLGRYLLRIKITTKNENRINLSTALKRSTFLWFRGLGLGIPIVSFFCLAESYSDLKAYGITYWDRKNNLKITHGKIGFLRVMLVLLLPLILILLGTFAKGNIGANSASGDSEEKLNKEYTIGINREEGIYLVEDEVNVENTDSNGNQEVSINGMNIQNSEREDISESSQDKISTFEKPSLDMDGYGWGNSTNFEKRELISTLMENKGKYLSQDDIDLIVLLVDVTYAQYGEKYKTVAEVLKEYSESSQSKEDSFVETAMDIDGYDWSYLTNFEKREFINTEAENNGEYLSQDEVDSIIYLIDGYYENGRKYKTVREAVIEISESSQSNVSTLGASTIDIDGYDWSYLTNFEKRELISTVAENNGEYLSRGEVDSIIYLIDGYYKNGRKYKTVGEVLREL